GCTADDGGTGTAQPSPSAAAPSEALPSGEPPSVAIDPEDPATWTIDGAGIGPISLGGDFRATLDDLPEESWTNDDNCPWAAFWNAPDAGYGLHFAQGTEAADAPIGLVSVSAPADAVDSDAGPRTDQGLGLGATKDEVRAQHPDAVEAEAAIGGGSFLSITADEGSTVFFEYAADGAEAFGVTVTTLAEP